MIGSRRVSELTPRPATALLNNLAVAGYSYSSVRKARTYVSAALDFAVDERLIPTNPGAKVELPGASCAVRPSESIPWTKCAAFYPLPRRSIREI